MTAAVAPVDTGLRLHPITGLFPPMAADDFRRLVADIQSNGLIEPVWTYQGAIIDGRHRHAACLEAGVELRTREWDGTGSLTAFVAGMNLQRRHLTQSQKATVALEMSKSYKVEARNRQVAGGRSHGKGNVELPALVQEALEKGEAVEQVAKLVGVSPRLIYQAQQLKEVAPELAQQCLAGTLTVGKALKMADKVTTVEPDHPEHEIPGGKLLGVGVIRANEAINSLTRIPKNDALRRRGFQLVTDWIRHNKIETAPKAKTQASV